MPNYVSREGLERLRREHEELKTTKRRELAEKLQRAISAGDLSENADYQEAKEEQAFLEGRIAELEEAIASAEIIEEQTGGASAIVKVGST
ncbi:MAG: transcription elongation factor GreA, partial [Candidatus Terrybacteria bacterium]|nr:transcription elongation factor GreA [Candidatus Terrybacteria bacterium]